MERVQGFDVNNTSQYSSFDPVRSIENTGAEVYNYVNSANPFPELSREASNITSDARNILERSYDDTRNVVERSYDDTKNVLERSYDSVRDFADKSYDDLRSGLSDINYSDFYANDPLNSAIRDSMQSPYLNSYLKIDTPTSVIPILSPPLTPNNTSNDYNILFVLVVLLVLFVAWRYWIMN
ncbi:hypothetical protein [Acanthamoeba polyphaga mimivirus]|uniref:Uncharacterized protein n=5 Tax=Megamimivirinae TaxID=3044648 RepID=A0A2L2DJP6_MIMIV|nr:hypothetical protein MegaChil _gp0676 [Megavirus chiliensis]AEX61874.1 hypothetical protein c7_R811 [Megavirus courdo7]AFX92765.1 hypothetical protein CE11_00739 [Megavirus courdo11]AGD92622.1 hypothetical protein LBA_00704 [Megavirus lba]AVG46398.1 hypothetical protein [Acanthamoeba polyphaga mimivirus]QZX42954.1 hypothetical protein [Mimivirus sp.]